MDVGSWIGGNCGWVTVKGFYKKGLEGTRCYRKTYQILNTDTSPNLNKDLFLQKNYLTDMRLLLHFEITSLSLYYRIVIYFRGTSFWRCSKKLRN